VASTCCSVTTSCSVNSWIIVSLSSSSRRRSAIMTPCSSSTPWLSSSANSGHASLGVVAVAEKRPLLYFAACVLVVGLCVAM
jgi:hypothetical protein